ncbi:hypothetical protein BGX38DRAFT_1174623 [Terfezia claveryi]|nr:hypothetical protein BGX38DRAFT_1174623 [Terfezia claveryi]
MPTSPESISLTFPLLLPLHTPTTSLAHSAPSPTCPSFALHFIYHVCPETFLQFQQRVFPQNGCFQLLVIFSPSAEAHT